jgi:meso-butanediol dehydrogenase/(S,S)-butanediol dehydrogenase/diacetyl reductase
VGLLDNKNAVVTAASSGIGQAVVRRFIAEGATVIAVSRDQGNLERELGDLPSEQLVLVAGDAAEEETATRAMEAALERADGLDVLVNAVGVASFADIVTTTPEQWAQVLATNITSAYLFSRAAVLLMRARAGGSIVQISSLQGVRGDYNSAAYATTKAALNNLTRAMALDYGRDGIRVNAVAPGFIETPRTAGVSDERRDAIIAITPLRRTGHAKEVAATVTFLASDEASHVTGEILAVDGGRLAGVGSPPPPSHGD